MSLRSVCGCLLALGVLFLGGCATTGPQVTPITANKALYIDCLGEAGHGPTVILEAGAFETEADWDLVMADMAPSGRVCAYARAGLGSAPAQTRRPTVETITDELHDLLAGLGETAPVILVGHSNGALYAETFARRWPDRVAGLVYVDGVNSDAAKSPSILAALHEELRTAELAYAAGELGLAGLAAGTLIDRIGLTGKAAERKYRALTSLEHLRASRAEERTILAGVRETRKLPPMPAGIPIAALVAAEDPTTPLAVAWREVQLDSTRGALCRWLLDMPGATHVSPLGRDRAYVVSAVKWVRDRTAATGRCTAQALPDQTLP